MQKEQQQRRVYIPPLAQVPHLPPAGDVVCMGGETMGTTWRCLAVCEGTAATILQRGIETHLQLVIDQMSTWEPGSDISRLNHGPHSLWHALAPEFFEVLSCALRIARETNGAYDPTVGPAVDLWGFGPRGRATGDRPPSDQAIDQIRELVGWHHVDLDAEGRRVRLTRAGVTLDFSSIAKGYAVDLVARFLDASGVCSYLIEIGGELKGRGIKPDGQPWWVELEGEPPAVVALCDTAVASSGDYLRNFLHNGELYGHTIDPRTCRPVSCGRIPWAVNVVHESCMAADAYATAILVAGIDLLPDIAARVIYNGQAFETGAMREMGD